jgi:hypothetical protein
MSSVILLVFWNLLPHREEGSRTLTILQKTFDNDRVMFVFQVCFCDIDEEEGSRTLTILQKTFGNDRVMFVFHDGVIIECLL